MKLKWILLLADHLGAIRSKLSPESWEVVIGSMVSFCRQSNQGFRESEFMRYLNRRE